MRDGGAGAPPSVGGACGVQVGGKKCTCWSAGWREQQLAPLPPASFRGSSPAADVTGASIMQQQQRRRHQAPPSCPAGGNDTRTPRRETRAAELQGARDQREQEKVSPPLLHFILSAEAGLVCGDGEAHIDYCSVQSLPEEENLLVKDPLSMLEYSADT